MSVLSGHWAAPRRADAANQLRLRSEFVEAQIQSLHRQDIYFQNATQILKDMESTIGRTIAGEAPSAEDWGTLTASEFLRIVHHVTTWSLTNFEAFKARPASEDPPAGTRLWETPYFKIWHRYQAPYEAEWTIRTLSSVNLPELRCLALWWASALLRIGDRCCDRAIGEPQRRQVAFLRQRCPVGLHWLRLRMTHWPAAYVRRQWTALELLY